jgi:hypothetical protein
MYTVHRWLNGKMDNRLLDPEVFSSTKIYTKISVTAFFLASVDKLNVFHVTPFTCKLHGDFINFNTHTP